jgi:hypothetical protein
MHLIFTFIVSLFAILELIWEGLGYFVLFLVNLSFALIFLGIILVAIPVIIIGLIIALILHVTGIKKFKMKKIDPKKDPDKSIHDAMKWYYNFKKELRR